MLLTAVAAYIRVSTDEQAVQGISIPAQKNRLIAYCRAQGWDLRGFYIDDGYSGKDLARPAMQRLIADAQMNMFDTVLVLKLDRLSRRQKDVLYLLEDVFQPAGIGFKSATETFDTTSPFGKASLGMMAVFSQLERETTVERVCLAKRESARQGRFPGGPPPFGYIYNPNQKALEIDEIKAATVRWLYNRYATGAYGYRHLGDLLEQMGVPGPTSMRWNKNCIRKILTNPIYAGLIAHKGTFFAGRHEPIIQREEWEEVQALIKARGSFRASAPAHSSLLSGLIVCGECGARMRAKNVWQNYPRTAPKKITRYYVCYSQDGSAGHMARQKGCRCGYKHAEEIESKVTRELCNFSFDQNLLKQTVAETLAKNSDKNGKMRILDAVKQELSLINKKLEKWYEAFEKGDLDPDMLMERVKGLRQQRVFLNKKIIDINFLLKEKESRRTTAEEILEIFRNFPAIWAEATPQERREIIVNLVNTVTVYRTGRIDVKFTTNDC